MDHQSWMVLAAAGGAENVVGTVILVLLAGYCGLLVWDPDAPRNGPPTPVGLANRSLALSVDPPDPVEACFARVRHAAERFGLVAVETGRSDFCQFRKGQVTLTGYVVIRGAWQGTETCLRLVASSPAVSTRLAFFEVPRSSPDEIWRQRRTGDHDFDRRVLVVGLDPWVATVLGRQARRALGWISEHRVIRPGAQSSRFEVEVSKPAQREVDRATQSLIDAMQGLEFTPGDAPLALASNLLHDPSQSVRLNCLELLAEHFPRHAETLKAVAFLAGLRAEEWSRAMESRSPAASALALLVGSLAPAELRVAALARAHKTADPDSLRETMLRALGDGRGEVRHAALDVVRESRDVRYLGQVVKMARDGRGGDRAAAVSTLIKLWDLRGEEALIEALDWAAPELRSSVVRALGGFGTPRAVGPLRALARLPATPGDTGPALVERAIQRIRDRHRHVLPGEVSLAAVDGVEGSLSVGTGPGELSPVEGL